MGKAKVRTEFDFVEVQAAVDRVLEEWQKGVCDELVARAVAMENEDGKDFLKEAVEVVLGG